MLSFSVWPTSAAVKPALLFDRPLQKNRWRNQVYYCFIDAVLIFRNLITRKRESSFNVKFVDLKGTSLFPRLCNTSSPRLIFRAELFSHPWTAMIAKREDGRTFFCGGTVICAHWVLTVAHCMNQQTIVSPEAEWVRRVKDLRARSDKRFSFAAWTQLSTQFTSAAMLVGTRSSGRRFRFLKEEEVRFISLALTH